MFLKIKRWIKSLFYVPKYEKVSDVSFSRLILTSVFGILISAICLAGLTWSWFSSSATSNSNNITSAIFSVDISVKSGDTEVSRIIDSEIEKYKYELNAGTEYTVTLTANGDAETYGGYCSVFCMREEPYHTVQLYPENIEGKINSVTFYVNTASLSSILTIIPQWGTYARPLDEQLIGGTQNGISSISSAEPASESPMALMFAPKVPRSTTEDAVTYTLTDTEQLYTVQAGDTLAAIADRYGTSVAVLSAYNSITNTNDIKAGAILRIPPASYEVPENNSSQTTAAESEASVTPPAEPQEETEKTSTSLPNVTVTETVSAQSIEKETVSEENTVLETQEEVLQDSDIAEASKPLTRESY